MYKNVKTQSGRHMRKYADLCDTTTAWRKRPKGMDVYADNRGIIADGVPETKGYMKEVLPNREETESFKKELLEIVVDVTESLLDAG